MAAHTNAVAPAPTEDFGVWMSSDAAARYLDFPSYKSFWEWQKRHGLASCRRGRRMLFAKADLDRAIGARRAR